MYAHSEITGFFALVGITLLTPFNVHAERVEGIRFLASDSSELNKNGIHVKMSRLNRNFPDEQRAGNLSVTIFIDKNTPLPISRVDLSLGLLRSADTTVPVNGIDSKSGRKYSFFVGACDLDRTQAYIHFDFPENYSEDKYYYYLKLSSFAKFNAQIDEHIQMFMNTRSDICKELGVGFKVKPECVD